MTIRWFKRKFKEILSTKKKLNFGRSSSYCISTTIIKKKSNNNNNKKEKDNETLVPQDLSLISIASIYFLLEGDAFYATLCWPFPRNFIFSNILSPWQTSSSRNGSNSDGDNSRLKEKVTPKNFEESTIKIADT